jgi:AbrB family looped-hinge helix DNA binding protein
MKSPPRGNRRFYGAVKVSERGQIVIPVEARRDFKIEIGDKLLVLGDLQRGIALAPASVLIGAMDDVLAMLQSEERRKQGDSK